MDCKTDNFEFKVPNQHIIQFTLTVSSDDAKALTNFKSTYEYFGKKMEQSRRLKEKMELMIKTSKEVLKSYPADSNGLHQKLEKAVAKCEKEDGI